MGKEVIQGIFGGLIAVVIVAAIGSMIASATSHGPKPAAEAAQEAPAEAAPAADEAPAEEEPAAE